LKRIAKQRAEREFHTAYVEEQQKYLQEQIDKINLLLKTNNQLFFGK